MRFTLDQSTVLLGLLAGDFLYQPCKLYGPRLVTKAGTTRVSGATTDSLVKRGVLARRTTRPKNGLPSEVFYDLTDAGREAAARLKGR